jgi:putative flippase GtrA
MNNKINVFNSKNQVWENYQAETKTALSKKAQELYKDLRFDDEYKSTYLSAIALRAIANVLSAFTFLIAFYLSLAPLLGAYVSVSLGALACLVLEYLKNRLWTIQAKNTLKYKKYSRYLIAILVCLHGLSLAGSSLGAWQLPTLISLSKFSEVAEVKADSLSSNFGQRISIIDKQIKNLESKALSSSSARAIIGTLAKERQELTKAQTLRTKRLNSKADKQTTKAEKESRQEKKKHAKRVLMAQYSCLIIAILFELMYIFCSLFIAFYLFRLFVDDSDDSDGSDGQESQISTANVRSDGSDGQERIVIRGFGNFDSKRSKLDYTKICEFDACSMPFVHKIHNQKYCSKLCRQKAHYKGKQKNKEV